jgi:biotin carboxyl carrier protein
LRYELEVGGRVRQVVLSSLGDGFAVTVDGRTRYVQPARIGVHSLFLMVGEVWPKGDTPPAGVQTSGALKCVEVAVAPGRTPGSWTAYVGPVEVSVALNGRRRRDQGSDKIGGPQRILAPMPGKIVRLLVKTGEKVRAGQPLVVVEAMKMENEVRARWDGTIAQTHVKEGASVEADALLVVIE